MAFKVHFGGQAFTCYLRAQIYIVQFQYFGTNWFLNWLWCFINNNSWNRKINIFYTNIILKIFIVVLEKIGILPLPIVPCLTFSTKNIIGSGYFQPPFIFTGILKRPALEFVIATVRKEPSLYPVFRPLNAWIFCMCWWWLIVMVSLAAIFLFICDWNYFKFLLIPFTTQNHVLRWKPYKLNEWMDGWTDGWISKHLCEISADPYLDFIILYAIKYELSQTKRTTLLVTINMVISFTNEI